VLVTIAVLATAMALFALVVANVFLGQAAVTQAELQDLVHERSVEVEQLELEVARLGSPSRIAQRATQLGLVQPTDVTVLVPAEPARRGERGSLESDVAGESHAQPSTHATQPTAE